MSIDGTWNINLETPVGTRALSLTLETKGAEIVGSMETPMGPADVNEGTLEGENVAWKATLPYGVVEFSAVVTGDNMTGQAKLADLGTGTFAGTRS